MVCVARRGEWVSLHKCSCTRREEPGVTGAWTVVADGHGHGHASRAGWCSGSGGAPLRSELAFSLGPVVPFALFRCKSVSPFSVGLLALAVVPQGLAVRCGTWTGPRRPTTPAGPGAAVCRAHQTALPGEQKLLLDNSWVSCFNRVSLFHGLQMV